MQTQKLIAMTAVLAVLAACHSRHTYYTPPSIDGLRFKADAKVIADTLDVILRAINRARRGVVIEFDQCDRPNDLSVKATAAGKEWDSRLWELERLKAVYNTSSQRRFEPVCAGGVLVTVLQPGAQLPYRLKLPFREIVGDSLAAGKYQITASININGRTIRNLKAGEIYVRLPANTR